jgi:hypothetical protein
MSLQDNVQRRPSGLACVVKQEVCPQSDLLDKVLYLRPCEYWSHLIHPVKDLKISISMCTEYAMF